MNDNRKKLLTIFTTALIISFAFYAFYLSPSSTTDEHLKILDGRIQIYLNGRLVVDVQNTITYAFLNTVRDHISNSGEGDYCWNYIAIGDGSGGGASSTTLESETNRTLATYSEPANYQWRLTAEFNEWNYSFGITEAGVLSQSSGGVLMNYQDFASIGVEDNDNLTVAITFTGS